MGNCLKYIFSRLCCRWCRIRRKKSEFEDPNLVTLIDDKVGEEEYMPTQEVKKAAVQWFTPGVSKLMPQGKKMPAKNVNAPFEIF